MIQYPGHFSLSKKAAALAIQNLLKPRTLLCQIPLLLAFVLPTLLASGQTPSISASSASCDDPVFFDFAGHISGTASGPVGSMMTLGAFGLPPTVGVNRGITCGSWSQHFDPISRTSFCLNDSGTNTNWTVSGQFLPSSGFFISTFEGVFGGGGIVSSGTNRASSFATVSCTMTIIDDGNSITVGPASILNVMNCVNQSCSNSSQPLKITTISIPDAIFNTAYTFSFQASGGTPPYTWAVQSGSGNGPLNNFPLGFQFSSAGIIGVDPSTNAVAGSYGILVTVTDSQQKSDSKQLNMTVSCGDPQRDQLTAEYIEFGTTDLTFTLDNPPACVDFTQTAHSLYFSFSDLNKPGPSTAPLYSWALIRYPLTVPAIGGAIFGLDTWVKLLGAPTYQGIINSGYRSPSQNATAGGVAASRHMWGDAVDLRNLVHPSGTRTSCNPQYPNPPTTITACYSEYRRMVQAAGFAQASYIETPDLGCKYNCVHADWRNLPGAFQQ